jgi:hypothetical protein
MAKYRQALAPLPNFSGQYPVLGSWLIDHTPCGLSIREDENPITGNTSRFLPHAILQSLIWKKWLPVVPSARVQRAADATDLNACGMAKPGRAARTAFGR